MATATSKLQIIIDVMGDKAQRGLKGIKGNLIGITAAIGVATAAAYTAKKAWDFTKEGAALELTATQFANVATNAGYLSDALLGKMRAATSGMVSDAELMASGLSIIELGLADSEEGIISLATSVAVLGLDMQQVIMTFANNSEMRLDSLGLSVEKVRNRVKELNAEGFDGDAFDQAVMEGLEERMDVLGDTAETTAGQMQILETAIANFTDEAKRAAAESASGTVEQISREIIIRGRLLELKKVGLITDQQQIDIEWGLASGTLAYSDALAQVTNLEGTAASTAKTYANAQGGLNDEVEFTTSLLYSESYAYGSVSAAMREGGEYVYDAAAAQEELNTQTLIAGQAYTDLAVGIGNATQANRDRIDYLTSGGAVLNLLAAQVEQAIAEGDFGVADALNDELTKADIDFQLEAGDVDATEAANRLVEELDITPAEADAIVDELESTLFEVTAVTRMLKFGVTVDWSNLPPGVTPPAIGWGDGGIEITPPSDQWRDTSGDDPSSDEFATGTNGWLQVPGSSGQPRNITVHGGEMMNVVPAGQSGGSGGNVIWNGDAIFQTSDAALEFVSAMQQRASRNAASMAAGGAYIGQ